MAGILPWAPDIKVFCFFSSEKKSLPHLIAWLLLKKSTSISTGLPRVTNPPILRTRWLTGTGVVSKVKQKSRAEGPGSAPLLASVLEEARKAGLLDGEKTEHVSFRAPPALVDAAKREAGISSTSELGVMALAMLARPDPVAAFFRRTEGRLGPDHDLEY